ncbi:hypothetical protein CSA37_00480 [Candidatus Fermentibacteria bacterium]|nr:MAG: hypothetical protein CSA37_00480 [Candidatus Fermentibacteria bacterium]
MKKPDRRKLITAGILLVFAVLSVTGLLASLQKAVVLQRAENYVEQSQEKALAAFITISAVKGIVAVVEGSDIVGIEVGDIVQPLYDAVDIAWKLITVSLASLYVIEILLKLCESLSPAFLTITFALLLLFQFMKKPTIRKTAFFTGILSFTFYLAIPFTLFISGFFSEGYSRPVREEFDIRMDEFQQEYERRIEEIKKGDIITIEGGEFSLLGEKELPSIDFPKFYLVIDIIEDMGALARELPDLLLRTGVSWILDVIIVPLGLLFILYKLTLIFVESVFGSARADRLEKTLQKYLNNCKDRPA